MELLGTFGEIVRDGQFTNQRGESVTALDFTFKAGCDEVVIGAFGDLARTIKEGNIKKGVLYAASVVFKVNRTQEGRTFQQCALQSISVVYDSSAF